MVEEQKKDQLCQVGAVSKATAAATCKELLLLPASCWQHTM